MSRGNQGVGALELLQIYRRLSAKRAEGLTPEEEKQLHEAEREISRHIDPQTKDHPPPRRQDLRVETRMEVAIKDADSLKKLYIRNLSGGGLYIETLTPPPVGTKLEVKLTLPGHPKLVETLVEVCWANPRPVSELPPGMGVKFISLDAEARKVIQNIISQKVEAVLAPQGNKPKP